MENVFDELNKINDEYSLKDYSDDDLKKNKTDLFDEDVDDMSTLRNKVKTYIPEVLNMIKTVQDSGETSWRTFVENSSYQTIEASILIDPQGYFNKVPKGVSRFTLSYRFKHSNSIQSYRISITEYEDIMIDVDTGFWDYYRNNEYQGKLDALKGFIRYFDDVQESFDNNEMPD